MPGIEWLIFGKDPETGIVGHLSVDNQCPGEQRPEAAECVEAIFVECSPCAAVRGICGVQDFSKYIPEIDRNLKEQGEGVGIRDEETAAFTVCNREGHLKQRLSP